MEINTCPGRGGEWWSCDQVQSPWPNPFTPGTQLQAANHSFFLSLKDGIEGGWNQEHAPLPTSSNAHVSFSELLLCASCGQGLTGRWPQEAHSVARSHLPVRVPAPSEAALPPTAFPGCPGAGRRLLSVGFSEWDLIIGTPYPAGKGEASKVTDVSLKGQETTYTETFVPAPSGDLSGVWVTTIVTPPSYLIPERTKLEGNTWPWRRVIPASHHKTISYSE